MSKETIIQSKVVSSKKIEKTLLQKMPGYQKFKNLADSFLKVFWGILFIFGAMLLTYTSVKSVKDNSKLVKNLNLVQVQENTNLPERQLIKIQGKAFAINPLSVDYKICKTNQISENTTDSNTTNTQNTANNQTKLQLLQNKCKEIASSEALNNLIYYNIKYERYEQHLETEHETKTTMKDGEEYEETVETQKLVEDWNTISTDSAWTQFKIGNIIIDPVKAKTVITPLKKVITHVYIPNANNDYYVAEYANKASPQVGDTRLTIEYIPNNTTMLVVGKIKDGVISSVSSDTFIISNLEDNQLIRNLEQSETTMRMGMRILSWALYTFGFMMIVGPILALLDFLPIIGKLGRGLTFIISALISLILVTLGVLIVKYFAIIFIMILIAGVIAVIGTQRLKEMSQKAVDSIAKHTKKHSKKKK